MFLPAPRQFRLSEETKASIKAEDVAVLRDELRPSSELRASLLRAARKAREQISSQWLDFSPGPPVLAKKRYFDVKTDGWAEEQVMVQLDSKAFGKGALRECFRMKEVRLESREFVGHAEGKLKVSQTKDHHLCFEAIACGLMELPRNGRRTLWVAKRSIADHHRKIMHKRECETDVIHQTFAKHYAELFNQEIHRHAVETGLGRCGAHDIDFLLTHVVELPERVTVSAEAFVLGEYRKHNTNGGSTMGPRTTPQAFSYFTFIKSGRRLMIVDIQGVLDLYTDPVIHFLPSRVSGKLAGADMELNFGIKGFALFLWSHRRNDIDQLLNLPVFALSCHEEKHLAPSSSRTVSQLIATSKKDLSDPSPQTHEPGDFVVLLAETPGVDLSDWCNWRGAVRHRSGDVVPPEDLIEAECHMEIAAMYHQGRITLRDEPRGPPEQKEVESAVFHLVEAARQDLPEALLALARLCSDEEHADFLPQVKGSQPNTMRALLARAATLGARHAMAAFADLVFRDPSSSTEELQLACEHLEAFAEDVLEERRAKAAMAEEESEEEEEEDDEEEEEEVDQEHNSLHKKNFGWDAHGYDAPSALRRAAELFEGPLAEVPNAASRAADLRDRSKAAEPE